MKLNLFVISCLYSIFATESANVEDEQQAMDVSSKTKEIPRVEKLDFSARIVGGNIVRTDKYNWIASVQDFGHYCGSSLIGDRWILTAAHCLDGFAKPDQVVLNQNDLSKSSPNRVVRKVKKVYIHPDYDDFTVENDIAIMELKKRISGIAPIALASEGDYTVGLGTKALGWGTTREGGQASDQLRIVTVPLVSYDQCTSRGSYSPGDIDKASMICAGYRGGGKDSCQGDSGGPLMYENSDGVQKLVGVVSWGEGCAKKNKYGVYARVATYLDWIRKTTRGEVTADEPTPPPSPSTISTDSPTIFVDPISGWEGWVSEANYCKRFRRRSSCDNQDRCQFKRIKGMNRNRLRCYPSRNICLPN